MDVKEPHLPAFQGGRLAASSPQPQRALGKRSSLKVRKEEWGEPVSEATLWSPVAVAGPCRPVQSWRPVALVPASLAHLPPLTHPGCSPADPPSSGSVP